MPISADIPAPESSGNSEAYVYVIHAEDGDVKIGVAKNAWNRLKGLQTAHSRKLSIFYKIGCLSRVEAYAIESRAHKILENRALEGEWFSASPEDARAAVERAICDMRAEREREEKAAARVKAKIEGKTYIDPEITPAESWMRDAGDVIKFVLAQKEPKEEYLFSFGDCVIFVGCRRQKETGEWFFFMNDVSRWYMREEDGSACSNNPLGNPPCALLATASHPLRNLAGLG
jgi:hypothetical protein